MIQYADTTIGIVEKLNEVIAAVNKLSLEKKNGTDDSLEEVINEEVGKLNGDEKKKEKEDETALIKQKIAQMGQQLGQQGLGGGLSGGTQRSQQWGTIQ